MPRVMLIGLDGLEPGLVRRWMAEGRLPNLQRIAESGAFLDCASTVPPVTFPAWTTCVTGVNPGRHGIIDFTEMVPGDYAIRFVNSTYRRTPAFWNVLSDAGKRCCVLGVPGTYPPEVIDGVMVAGWDSPVCTRVDASFVHPPEMFDAVRDWRFADFQESRIDESWHDRALPKLLEGIDTKERIACDLLAREPWDFFMLVFGESDTVGHHFWMFHDENSPRHRPGPEHAIRDIYERLDRAVGELRVAAGDDVLIGIVSDHGFGGAGATVAHINNFLHDAGCLEFSPMRESILKRLGLTLVPPGMRGALFRKLGGLASRAESASRFGGIDWSHTRAWSEELDYFPSVRINLRGREPNGTVEPGDYDATVDALRSDLEAWKPVGRVWRRSEIYDGPHADKAPDLIIEPAYESGYTPTFLRARGGPALRDLSPEEFTGGKERGMNGTHRPTGVFMWSESIGADRCTLADVTPTVLAALGVPGPEMEGRSLTGSGSTSGYRATERPVEPYTAEEEAALEQRLRELGYLE